MRLAAFCLAIIALTHYGYDILAMAYEDRAQAARAIFYVLRGVEGTALFALVGILARRPLVILVFVWGAVEESQTAVCRLAAGIGETPGYAPFQGLCGAPWYTLGLMAAAGLAVHLLDKGDKENG
jgi:hypothetical protein